ncbi:uncharacterized protein TNCV_3974781 [Trichonephila clavipes]|nr:uncharacterized protein TNCV_3974781 [Trichonephila clavipes]
MLNDDEIVTSVQAESDDETNEDEDNNNESSKGPAFSALETAMERYLQQSQSYSTTVAAVAEWYRYRIVACLVTSSIPVPLKTRRVGQRCSLNLSRAQTSFRWCDVEVRRGGCQLRCRPRHLTMV